MKTTAIRRERGEIRLSTQIIRKGTETLRRAFVHLVLMAGGIVFMVPFVFLVSTSLKALRQIVVFPPIWIPNPVIWRNYTDVFFYAPFHRYFLNTLLITSTWVIGAVLTSSLAAYAFARLRAPGRDALFMIMLSTMMVPGMVRLIPTYIVFAKLDWIDTFLPLTIPSLLGSAFYIFLLRQFFMTIPMELEDAALIDGCSRFGIWWKIVLPLAKPALATVTIFSFMGAWNDFLGPLIYLNNRKLYTLAIGLMVFTRAHGSEGGLLMAASTMMITPIILLFFLAQKQFVQGIVLTGIKG